ncbi:hypothetical protein [Streptacidiphilus sp. EB129]|uniref:hypothetical protein n=1 Tax=Streptacidiphilus sp. EB129 TaxID=3156262 RepID=UPI003515C85B
MHDEIPGFHRNGSPCGAICRKRWKADTDARGPPLTTLNTMTNLNAVNAMNAGSRAAAGPAGPAL